MRFVSARLLAPVAVLAVCLPVAAKQSAAPKRAANQLVEVLADIEKSVKAKKLPIVIIDLDDTAFDTRQRHLTILRRFAEQIRAESPEAAAKIDGLKVEQMGYAHMQHLDLAGIADPAIRKAFAEFWSGQFFGELCEQDATIPGSVAFVRAARRKGALIVYLTGRDTRRALDCTLRALVNSGLPIGVMRTELIMKPRPDMDDTAFKESAISYIRRLGTVAAALDNEPANVNLFKKEFPEAKVIFLETRHSPGAPPVAPGISKIRDFRLK